MRVMHQHIFNTCEDRLLTMINSTIPMQLKLTVKRAAFRNGATEKIQLFLQQNYLFINQISLSTSETFL